MSKHLYRLFPLIAVMGLLCLHPLRGNVKPLAQLKDLRKAVDEIVKSNPESYQLLLYRISHVLKDMSLEPNGHLDVQVKWRDVKEELDQQSVKFASQIPYEGEAGYYSYTFAKDLKVHGSSLPHQLEVEFSIDKKRMVVGAVPHLICTMNKPFLDSEVQNGYEPDSVVGQLFKVDNVIKHATKYPVLTSVDISYSSLVNRWVDFGPMGFLVVLRGLGKSKDGEKLTGSFVYTAGSLLDPVQHGDGSPVSDEPFIPTDKLVFELGEGSSDPDALTGGKPSVFLPRGGEEGVGFKPGQEPM